MLLVTETQQDFTTILTLLNDITHTLGLNEIQQQLSVIPLLDDWERTVGYELRADMQHISGQLVELIVSTEAKSCADYLELHIEKQAIKHYWRLYQEIKNTAPLSLLPYVALIRALAKLINIQWRSC